MTYVYSQPIFSFSSWADRAATMYEVQKSWLLTTGNWNITRGSTCLLSQRVCERRWILTEISLKEISALSFRCWVLSTAFHLDRCLVQPPQCHSLSLVCCRTSYSLDLHCFSTFSFLGDNLGLEKGDYSNRGYMCLSQYQMFSSLSLILLSVTSWDSSSQVMTVSVLWLSPCFSSEVMLKWNGHCDSWLTRRGLLDGLSCSTAAAIFRFKFVRDFSTCNKVHVSSVCVLYWYYSYKFCVLQHLPLILVNFHWKIDLFRSLSW